MFKYFISTGCSFSEVPHQELFGIPDPLIVEDMHKVYSWPVHVTKTLQCTPQYKGKGASGNGIISRTTIYEVLEALKTYKPEDILVGVMWSGAYRQEVYATEPKFNFEPLNNGVINQSNPASVGGEFNFYKVMPYWEDEYSKWYYKNVYDEVWAQVQTLENILRVQWFLKNYNIRYFMTCYYPLVFSKSDDIMNHPDVKYLYDAIDFNDFLDVDSEFEWCARLQDPRTWDYHKSQHAHPHTKQHKAFTDNVIIPHLQKKGWI